MLLKINNLTRRKIAFSAGLILSSTLIFSGCAGRYFHEMPLTQPPSPITDLSQITCRESWYGVSFKGRKIGFAHFKIEKIEGDDLFRLESETLIRLKLSGYKKEISSREHYYIHPDLSLKSFICEVDLGGSRRRVEGEVEARRLMVIVETENTQETQSIDLTEAIYPGVAMYFYPVLKGLSIGKEYTYSIYSPETLSLERVSQRVKAYESSVSRQSRNVRFSAK